MVELKTLINLDYIDPLEEYELELGLTQLFVRLLIGYLGDDGLNRDC